ncbi:hypothetical protein [Turicimonas muris]|uniref:hypothetical protein n=1 Tax=Turicimonas muris TaxID=1796652 RepID=UPI00248CC5FD|nr:hypothetical protein [Turicimonas muris]
MDEKPNEKHVNLTRTEAVQVIVAALQSGTLKLPCTTEFHQQLQKFAAGPTSEKFGSTWYRGEKYSIDDILKGKYIDQFVIPARADGLYLLALFEALTVGISKEALSNYLMDAARQ